MYDEKSLGSENVKEEGNLQNMVMGLAISTGTEQGVVDRTAPAVVRIGHGGSNIHISRREWSQVKFYVIPSVEKFGKQVRQATRTTHTN